MRAVSGGQEVVTQLAFASFGSPPGQPDIITTGTAAKLGVLGGVGLRAFSWTRGGSVAWILRLVKTGVDGEAQGTDLMEIRRPDDLDDIANLGLTLSEAKLVLASVQREIATAQARDHVVRRPDWPRCDGVCHVKDYRDHAVATLFGQVTIKLPRFRCARCGGTETGIGWPSHCRSTPEPIPERCAATP
jgi:hypothetical protein